MTDLRMHDFDPLKYDGHGQEIDWAYLARKASFEDVSTYLSGFDSYRRTRAMVHLMSASPSRRCLEIFLDWGNMCDPPWIYRSYIAAALRIAVAEVRLIEMLGPDERALYEAFPATVSVWRGCEHGRERGLSWTTDRAVAEAFAEGKRCINKIPTLVSAEIPKRHIFGVFLSRKESEIALDPRRLRKVRATRVGIPGRIDGEKLRLQTGVVES